MAGALTGASVGCGALAGAALQKAVLSKNLQQALFILQQRYFARQFMSTDSTAERSPRLIPLFGRNWSELVPVLTAAWRVKHRRARAGELRVPALSAKHARRRALKRGPPGLCCNVCSPCAWAHCNPTATAATSLIVLFLIYSWNSCSLTVRN